jgi:hypothetical protein
LRISTRNYGSPETRKNDQFSQASWERQHMSTCAIFVKETRSPFGRLSAPKQSPAQHQCTELVNCKKNKNNVMKPINASEYSPGLSAGIWSKGGPLSDWILCLLCSQVCMKLAKTLLYFTFDFNSDPLVSYRVISLV